MTPISLRLPLLTRLRSPTSGCSRSVRIVDGETQLTRTPRRATSLATSW
jgi:hypothetical protein